jgi:hypothetical protein
LPRAGRVSRQLGGRLNAALLRRFELRVKVSYGERLSH